ncbi:hypothetical protein M0802_003910 [Mischocyttarus mexicanus]|nr:hypothetical protein M0802_003910 [Mischocyttarus mexicanus]
MGNKTNGCAKPAEDKNKRPPTPVVVSTIRSNIHIQSIYGWMDGLMHLNAKTLDCKNDLIDDDDDDDNEGH